MNSCVNVSHGNGIALVILYIFFPLFPCLPLSLSAHSWSTFSLYPLCSACRSIGQAYFIESLSNSAICLILHIYLCALLSAPANAFGCLYLSPPSVLLMPDIYH